MTRALLWLTVAFAPGILAGAGLAARACQDIKVLNEWLLRFLNL